MPKLLVTGAAGHLGQRVLHHLIETQNIAPGDIVAGSRDAEKLSDWAAKGVITRKVDFDNPELATSFLGVDHILIISTDALGQPGKRLAQHKSAVAAAVQAGIKHIVYTSMPSPDDSLVPFAPDHLGTESAISISGISHTILRNSWYMENLFGALPQVLASGQWFTSAGTGKVGQVSREDCARAAAAALAATTDTSKTYTLTGPDALTNQDVAKTATAVLGKPITMVPVNDEQLVAGMLAAGVPDFVAPMLGAMEANTREGKIGMVTDDFKKLTGQQPMNLKTFFEQNKQTFAG